jgi:hypothetical protein
MAAEIYAPRVEFVTPQKWKARMMLSFDKAQSLAMARKLFPGEWFPRKKDEGLAEAALISLYAAANLMDYRLAQATEEEDPLS